MKKFMMNERLMIIHTSLYCSFIVIYCMLMVANYLWYLAQDEMHPKLQCRSAKVSAFSYCLLFLLNIGMSVLQAFMSSKFSAPGRNSRRKFMLIYQA